MRHALLALLTLAALAHAQTGPDVLLDQFEPIKAEKPGKKAAPPKRISRKDRQLHYRSPSDGFQRRMYAAFKEHESISFDVALWVQKILNGEYVRAEEDWSSVRTEVPDDFRTMAQATHVYLLWKVGVEQTFMDQWLKFIATNERRDSPAQLALETVIPQKFDAWLLQNPVLITKPEHEELAKIEKPAPIVNTVKAWSNLRNLERAESILDTLEPANKLSFWLAETAVYSHVKKNDLRGAAHVIKANMEPAVDASKNLEYLARQDLEIARILYQNGQLELARQFYLKIPKSLPSYIPAREELAWIYLRTGDQMNLRGELKTLSSAAFTNRFQPEVQLLRGISDLKMCLFNRVQVDLIDYRKSNQAWAQAIDKALKLDPTPSPQEPDDFTQLGGRTVALLQNEHTLLAKLKSTSHQPQVWNEYLAANQANLSEAQSRLSAENRRQWTNQAAILNESIRKMRFLQVEYESELHQFQARGKNVQNLVASNESGARVVSDAQKTMNFPVDTELWSDELFQLRSALESQCMKKGVQ